MKQTFLSLAFCLCSAAQAEQLAALDLSDVSFRVGAPQVVRGPFADEIDTFFNEIQLPNGAFRGFTSNGSTYAVDGPTATAMDGRRHLVRGPGPPANHDECGNWLNTTFKSGSKLYGLFHSESHCREPGGGGEKSMSIAVSHDNGLSWISLGQIISGEDSFRPSKVTGEGDCVATHGGDRFYIYAYCLRDSDYRIIAARAPLADPHPGKWVKWDGKDWTSPALGGHAAPIDAKTFGGMSYLSSRDLQIEIGAVPFLGGAALAFSRNKIKFEVLPVPLVLFDEQTWVRPAPTELMAYFNLIDQEHASPRLGDRFLISYLYLPPGKDFTQRYLVLQDVALRSGTPFDEPRGETALMRWRHVSGMMWATPGVVIGAFTAEKQLGYVLTAPDPKGTVALDDCILQRGDLADHLLVHAGECATSGYARLRKAGWVYTSQRPGTLPLYACIAGSRRFAATNDACDDLGTPETLIGYLPSP